MNTARSIQLSSKVKVSLDEILHGISKLDVSELEDFLQKLIELAQYRGITLDALLHQLSISLSKRA